MSKLGISCYAALSLGASTGIAYVMPTRSYVTIGLVISVVAFTILANKLLSEIEGSVSRPILPPEPYHGVDWFMAVAIAIIVGVFWPALPIILLGEVARPGVRTDP